MNQGLELLKWCADAAKGITAVAGAGVGDGVIGYREGPFVSTLYVMHDS